MSCLSFLSFIFLSLSSAWLTAASNLASLLVISDISEAKVSLLKKKELHTSCYLKTLALHFLCRMCLLIKVIRHRDTESALSPDTSYTIYMGPDPDKDLMFGMLEEKLNEWVWSDYLHWPCTSCHRSHRCHNLQTLPFPFTFIIHMYIVHCTQGTKFRHWEVESSWMFSLNWLSSLNNQKRKILMPIIFAESRWAWWKLSLSSNKIVTRAHLTCVPWFDSAPAPVWLSSVLYFVYNWRKTQLRSFL